MKDFNIPGRLRELRLQNSLTLAQVAKAINVAVAVYQNYETGRSKPPIQVMLRLQDLYCLNSVNELIGAAPQVKAKSIIDKYLSVSLEKRKIVDYILNT